MKTLNIYLEDKEYEMLIKLKKDKSWHDFLVGYCDDKTEEEE